ncbi:MAG: hypothetical protein EB059_03935 [Alphaproteobacteria bacterium]|nr:hypothetical protein [Alphaproteobacteria bacterium]
MAQHSNSAYQDILELATKVPEKGISFSLAFSTSDLTVLKEKPPLPNNLNWSDAGKKATEEKQQGPYELLPQFTPSAFAAKFPTSAAAASDASKKPDSTLARELLIGSFQTAREATAAGRNVEIIFEHAGKTKSFTYDNAAGFTNQFKGKKPHAAADVFYRFGINETRRNGTPVSNDGLEGPSLPAARKLVTIDIHFSPKT